VAEVSGEPESVRALRAELARIDRAIVMLLSARLTVAARVIEARRERGQSVTLVAQERVVLERVRDWSRDLDVPASISEGLFRSLIEAGKERCLGGDPAAGSLARALTAGPSLSRPRANRSVPVPG